MDFANDIGKRSADQRQAVTFRMQTARICQSQYWLHISARAASKVYQIELHIQLKS